MSTNKNVSTAVKLGMVSVAMFGFGYLLVPIYDVFCDLTGLNGKTGEISVAQAGEITADTSRLVTVEFDTNVNSLLPWEFKAESRKMQVHPGQITEAVFIARNMTDKQVIGQAVPSVAPAQASLYFNKTECFCFSQQALGPGESREMPVRFVVDPGLPESITMLTLSYTFFLATDAVVHTDPPSPEPTIETILEI